MPSDDARERMMEEARRLSSDDFLRTNEENRRRFSGQFVSIKDLAAERGKSVRTLRRWNNRPDAPQRVKIGRRLLYRRADVEPWLEQLQDPHSK
jgi:predicted DNA-binding transcriptional regulator AlpA